MQQIRKWIYLSASFFLLSIGALLIVLHTIYPSYQNNRHVKDVLHQTEQISFTNIESNKAYIQSNFKESGTAFASAKEYEDNAPNLNYDFSHTDQTHRLSIEPFHPEMVVGQLHIPDLEINLPVFEGTSKNHLYNGASSLKPNQELGKGSFSLASLNLQDSDFLFSNLSHATEDQMIYMSDKEYVYEYVISETRDSVKEIEELIRSSHADTTIQLITHADNDKESYLVVIAEFKYSYPLQHATENIKQVFS